MGGTVSLATTLTANAQQIDVSHLTVDLRDLEADGPEWLIRDPDLKLATTGRWDFKTQNWSSPKTSVTGQSVTMELSNFECGFGNLGLSKLVGTASYRADLTQLSGWKNLAIKNPSHYLVGTLSGTAGITRQDRLLIGEVDAKVEKMVVAGQGVTNGQPAWVALWKERELKVTGKGSYDAAIDKLALESSHIQVDGLSIAASGQLDECSTKQGINLTGDLAYEWDSLLKRPGMQLGQNIQVSGKDHRPFSIKGSLASLSSSSIASGSLTTSTAPASIQPGSNSVASNGTATSTVGSVDLSGHAGFGWASANVCGIKAGAGDVSAQLDRGVCRFAPLKIAVNDGTLHLTPTVYLDRNPFTVVLPQEKLVDQVSLSPELCANALKFVAPMLADSTQVDGKFSADMHSATLPLLAPDDRRC